MFYTFAIVLPSLLCFFSHFFGFFNEHRPRKGRKIVESSSFDDRFDLILKIVHLLKQWALKIKYIFTMLSHIMGWKFNTMSECRKNNQILGSQNFSFQIQNPDSKIFLVILTRIPIFGQRIYRNLKMKNSLKFNFLILLKGVWFSKFSPTVPIISGSPPFLILLPNFWGSVQ